MGRHGNKTFSIQAGPTRFLRSRKRRGDILSRAPAGIAQSVRDKPRQDVRINVQPFRLPHDWFPPGQTQPSEILVDRRFELFPAPRGVDVFDSQEKLAPTCLGRPPGCQGRKCVSYVKKTCRRWGKTFAHSGSLHDDYGRAHVQF